jgi:F-type H+-transporting ATPase subunit delta
VIKQSIARRYAKGLFSVGEKDGKYASYLHEMENILNVLESGPRLKQALMVPLMEMEKRQEILADLVRALDLSPAVSSLLSLLLERNKLEYLPMIRSQYGERLDEKEGRVKGSVYAAFPLDDQVKARMEEALAQRLNKKVELSVHEDRSLLGGAMVVIGGLRIDGSLKRQFEMLNESILKE